MPGVGDPQAWNRYAYTLNNPLRYVDPSGHCITEDWEHGNEDGWRMTGDSEYECNVSQFVDLPGWLRTVWFEMIYGDGKVLTPSAQAILIFLAANPSLRDPIEAALGLYLRPTWDCYPSLAESFGCSPGYDDPDSWDPAASDGVTWGEVGNQIVEGLLNTLPSQECALAYGAFVSNILIYGGTVSVVSGVGAVPGAITVSIGVVGHATLGSLSVAMSAQEGDNFGTFIGLVGMTIPPVAPGALGPASLGFSVVGMANSCFF